MARFGDDQTVIGYKVDEYAVLQHKTKGQDAMKTADRIMKLGESLVVNINGRVKYPSR